MTVMFTGNRCKNNNSIKLDQYSMKFNSLKKHTLIYENRVQKIFLNSIFKEFSLRNIFLTSVTSEQYKSFQRRCFKLCGSEAGLHFIPTATVVIPDDYEGQCSW